MLSYNRRRKFYFKGNFMSKVQEKINNVFEFMQGYIRDNGFPPSVREICASVGIKSTATCHAYLKKLEENGHRRNYNCFKQETQDG